MNFGKVIERSAQKAANSQNKKVESSESYHFSDLLQDIVSIIVSFFNKVVEISIEIIEKLIGLWP